MSNSKEILNNPAHCPYPHGNNHYYYWVPVDTFNSLDIKRWKFNRPPDIDRIESIREELKTLKRIDGIIYLGCVDGQLVCYEGNHRREALRGAPPGMTYILVDIIWDTTDDIIKQEFLRLNKSVSVPELYKDPDEKRREELEGVMERFCKKWKHYKSASAKPNRPNFNRDNLLQQFDRIMQEAKLTAEELEKRLDEVNMKYKNIDHSTLSETIVTKCTEKGLWLFSVYSELNILDFKKKAPPPPPKVVRVALKKH
jgi:hypothetical protein